MINKIKFIVLSKKVEIIVHLHQKKSKANLKL